MKADRLISLLLLLQTKARRPARELAEALEVSERTIYRDVDALACAGVPVYAERGTEGGIALAPGYRRAFSHFSDEEVRALFISGSGILADLGMNRGYERAREKMRSGFTDVQRRAEHMLRGRIHVDQRRWNQSDPPFDKLALLRRAVWEDRCVTLTYADRKRAQSERTIDPFGLVSKAGVWYLIARTQAGMRTFRVDRIVEVHECAEHFARPADFDLDAYWREASERFARPADEYAVLLRVDAEVEQDICAYWRHEPIDEREHILRIHFPSIGSATRFLGSWGDRIDVLEPSELTDALVAHARAILSRHVGPPTMTRTSI